MTHPVINTPHAILTAHTYTPAGMRENDIHLNYNVKTFASLYVFPPCPHITYAFQTNHWYIRATTLEFIHFILLPFLWPNEEESHSDLHLFFSFFFLDKPPRLNK